MSEQTIFLSALEYSGPERTAYLDKACAGNPALRQQVEELLAAHDRSGEFLNQPAVDQIAAQPMPSDQTTRTFSADANPTPGDRTVVHNESPGFDSLGFLQPPTRTGSMGRLDHYEILERIGVGGFGTVFRAFDDRLHRIVAIKVLAPAYAANGSARRRFVREARTAASVKNEHIVGIYDVKEDAQPPYLAMEMIDGISLQDKIDKTGPPSVKEILRIGLQTAEGLAAAHKQGLVHRDIKPSNILLENGVERVKITDFGLARAVDDASVTQSGTVAGTPMYMSPEQAEGLPIDHRSDLFSLGTVMYTMCTGHSPFRASGTHAVLKRVIEASPRPIREINDEIPEWLCDIIAKLHAKKPGERFQSAKEVAEILQQHLAHLQQPGQAQLPGLLAAPAPAAIAQPRRRFRWAAVLLVGVGLPLLLAPVFYAAESWRDHAGTWIGVGVVGAGLAVLLALITFRLLSTTASGELTRPDRMAATATAPESTQVREAPSAWRTSMAGAGLGMAFGLITGAIDPDAMRVSGRHTPLWLNGVYFALVGAAIGVLVGFMRMLLFARIGSEIRRATGKDSKAPTVSARRNLLWDFASLLPFLGFLLFLAGGYMFSDPVKLYMLDMGEVRIDDFHHDEFDSFVLISDASPEFVKGFPLPAHVPLFVEPGTYHIRAISKHQEKVQQWEIKNSREALGPATYQEGEECVLEIKRGQRINLSVAKWTPGDTDPSAGKWVQLFNGKNLDGWQTAAAGPGSWQVKDGILTGWNGPNHLYSTRDDFQNFHLRVEMAISKGAEADIYFRSKMRDSRPASARSPAGYVVDLAEGKDRYTGPVSFLNPTDNYWTTQGSATTVKADEWFALEIYAKGNHIMTKVNGVMVVDFVDTANSFQKGNIAFDVWKPDTVVKVRKIEIRELPANSPEVPKSAADVLPYLAGNWKLEPLNRDPKSPPDKDPIVGTFAYSFVAGGKFLRGRSSVVPTSDARTDTIGLLDLWSFEADQNTMRRWVARSDGWTSGAVTGQFAPASRTLTTHAQVGNTDSMHQYEFIDSNTFNHHIFRTDASGKKISEAHHKWTRVGGPVALPNVPLDPDRSDESKVLDKLVGEWQNEFTVKTVGSSDKPKAETTRGTTESILGGRFVETIEGNDIYTLNWFDAGTSQYRTWSFGSAGTFWDFAGAWNPNAKTMTWKSVSDVAVVSTWVFNRDDRVEFKNVLRAADGKSLIEVVGTSVRRRREVPRTAADVLPFLAGTWKIEKVDVVPKPPAGKERLVGHMILEYVADGKFLRQRGAFESGTVEPALQKPLEPGSDVPLVVFSYDPAKDALTHRGTLPNGMTFGPVLGRFDPVSHSLLWLKTFPGGIQSTHQFNFVDPNTVETLVYNQDETGKIVQELHLTFTRVAGPVTLHTQPTDPRRPAEMNVLDRLVGEWRNEITVSVAGPDTKVETVRVKAEPILGGRFIEKVETNDLTGASDYTLNWFDTDAKKYRTWFFNHAGSVTEFTGTWNEATKTLTWNSADGRLEGRWTFKGDDLREFRYLTKAADGKVVNEAVGKSVRQVRDIPRTVADVLPFMAGAWKVKRVDVDPADPKGKAPSTGDWIYDFVAGGKVLRGRGALDDGLTVPLVMFTVDAADNSVRQWQAWPDGTVGGPVSGQFVADTRTLMLHHRIGSIDSVHEFVFINANTFTHSYFHQDAGGKKLRRSLITFTRAPGAIVLPTLPTDPKRPAQMKNLDRLLGDWQAEATVKKSPTPDKATVQRVRFRAESVLAGRFVEATETDETGAASDYSLVWFNDAAKHYRQWLFSSLGQSFEFTGAWDEAGKTMSWNSQDGAMSGRWVFKGEDLREYRRAVRGLDGSSIIEVDGVARRTAQPRAVPKTVADVLPYLAGNWKVERQDLNPDTPPDKAVSVGYLTYDYVAGGKVLRARGDVASRDQSVLLHAYDRGQDRLQLWQAHSNGISGGPTTGAFNPASRTLTWTYLTGTGTPQNHEFTFTDPDKFTTHMYHLDKQNNIVRLANMTFTRIKEPLTIPILPIDLNRPNEMKVLDQLVGEWRIKESVTSVASPGKPEVNESRQKTQPILGGRFIETLETNETKKSSDYSLTWYDTQAKRYRLWAFQGNGQVIDFSGTWNEATKTLAVESQDGAMVGHTIFKSDGLFEFMHARRTFFEANGVARRIASPGFAPLFNGKDLTGWQPNPNWVARDGILESVPGGPNNVLLSERRNFGDFQLRAEVRIKEGGNSGIFVRFPGAWSKEIYEVQINSDDDPIKTGSLWNLGEAKAVKESPIKPDEWFDLEITAVDNDITVKVNGKVTTHWVDPDRTYTTGFLALQQWNAKKTAVQFRKIEIKELPPAASPAGPTSYFLTVWLPRFDGTQGRPNRLEVRGLLADLPSFAKPYYDPKSESWKDANWNIVDDGGKKNLQFAFAPTASSDLGDIAKALVELGGDKTKPVAMINLARVTPLTEDQFERLKKELAQAKGIDRKASDRNRLALDAAGGAKFEEIRTAYQKAGIELADSVRVGRAPADIGWTQLFNGNDLTGWKSLPGRLSDWKVENGVLTGRSGFLYSGKGHYENFALRLDVKVEDGDATFGGVFFRVEEGALPIGEKQPKGYLVKLGGERWRSGDLSRQFGEEQFVRGKEWTDNKPGEWFTLEIEARGPRLVVKVNGKPSVDYTDDKYPSRPGYVALGVYDASSPVHFRNIEIKELPGENPAGAIEKGPVPRIQANPK
jgi:hypothetical protein